ncbi:MAG TPA: hypothetical protein VMI93_16205 [Candidatus Solibacter sp.]|nr:hypothetical protein [Candidatus Solibacter sp.]
MRNRISRRNLLQLAAVAVPAGKLNLSSGLPGAGDLSDGNDRIPVSDLFPAHPPELIRETVTVAHFDLKRTKELVGARPSLARAAWDWGFGDWESPLGAASHMGNHAIAAYLISQGARPSLFSAAMLGQLDVVKAFVAAQPGVPRISGPHSISLLAHARVGGEAARAVFEFLQSLGNADSDAPVSLGDREAAELAGTYVFGVGVTQQVEVSADVNMYAGSKMYTHAPQLNWTRKGTMTRPLFHLGDHVFYPAGAPSARIHFTKDDGGILMTVSDPEPVLSARRKEESK